MGIATTTHLLEPIRRVTHRRSQILYALPRHKGFKFSLSHSDRSPSEELLKSQRDGLHLESPPFSGAMSLAQRVGTSRPEQGPLEAHQARQRVEDAASTRPDVRESVQTSEKESRAAWFSGCCTLNMEGGNTPAEEPVPVLRGARYGNAAWVPPPNSPGPDRPRRASNLNQSETAAVWPHVSSS